MDSIEPIDIALSNRVIVEVGLVTQRQLLHDVWGPAYDTETNYLRVYVAQLRRKLEPDPTKPRYLLTEPGMGYRFESTATT